MGHHHNKHTKSNNKHDHQDHHKLMIQDYKKRFWVSLIITIPILIIAPMIQSFFGYHLNLIGSSYILFALSTAVYFYGGFPFLKGMINELKKRKPGMMTLIAVAISIAFIYSTAVVFGFPGKTFFWELATLIVIMLLGHWLEMKSVLGASKALEELSKLLPDEANLITDKGEKKIPIKELKTGDLILIKPGEKIPTDGVITEGKTTVNESMLTGESKPVQKSKNSSVYGGAINQTGAIKVRVKNTGNNTYLSKVIKLVKEVQSKKSKTQKLADKAAYWLTIISLVVGTITFITWIVVGKDLAFAIERTVTVMVIACPHALGLAIPLVVSISTSYAAKNGLLIRNRTAFENSKNVTTVVFDKTGTLTKGTHEVTKIVSLVDNLNEQDILKIATAVEQNSEHHIAKGLIKKSKALKITIPKVSDFEYESGVGVSGKLNNKLFYVGGENMLKKHQLNKPKINAEKSDTTIFLADNNSVLGYISFADTIRESSFKAIQMLKKSNINCVLLTGDNNEVAKAVAKKLELKDYFANVLPDEKQNKIKELQDKGEIVAMTGDGVNDAPALAQSDIGIAVGSGTDVAAETADIILVNSDPKDVATLILFGKATYNKMIQNLIWATAYNIIAIPLAAGVLYSYGIMISPAIGAAFMAISTIVCALNAQLLKRKLINEE